MSKLLAILLSLIMLTQSLRVDFDDIVQLDELIEHAQFHKAEYGDNFLVFISKHYGELKEDHSKNHQEEEKEHEQLPFQCHDHVPSISSFVIQNDYLKIETFEYFALKDSRFHYQPSESTLHKKGLLQPPKHA